MQLGRLCLLTSFGLERKIQVWKLGNVCPRPRISVAFPLAAFMNCSDSNSDVEMILPFLREDRRPRWRELFPKPKGRKKLLQTLWNGDDFERSLMMRVDPSERTVQRLSLRLRRLGAPTFSHLISARPDLDGRDIDLISALGLVVNLAPATIICCMPGVLAYYENDDRNGNYIILRRKGK